MTTVCTAEEALERLAQGLPLDGHTITGPLCLVNKPLANDQAEVHCEVRLSGCTVESLVAGFASYYRPVCLRYCQFRNASFHTAWVVEGLEIVGCEFDGPVYFGEGGHNAPGRPVRIEECVFHEFVGFDDCLFGGPVIIRNCRFEKGSNLLSWARHPYGLAESDSLVLEGNVGDLDRPRPMPSGA